MFWRFSEMSQFNKSGPCCWGQRYLGPSGSVRDGPQWNVSCSVIDFHNWLLVVLYVFIIHQRRRVHAVGRVYWWCSVIFSLLHLSSQDNKTALNVATTDEVKNYLIAHNANRWVSRVAHYYHTSTTTSIIASIVTTYVITKHSPNVMVVYHGVRFACK